MTIRLASFLSAVMSWGAIVLILSGISLENHWGGGIPIEQIPPSSVPSIFVHSIGTPLSDQEIKLRGKGSRANHDTDKGVFPVEIHPGVIVDESGPVRLWDEVSVDGGKENKRHRRQVNPEGH